MKILITGGAGFIGSHLCQRLLEDRHEVLCVDNLITGRRENVQPLEGNRSFRFLLHNISLPLQIQEKIDYVLHFASPASPPDYLMFPIQTMKVGSLGTLNALGIAKAQKAKFLLASTSEVYGDPLENPQRESYWGHVNPIGPRGVYDEAKRFAEALTMAYHREHGLDTRIVRIFNIYGPRMRREDGRAIPNFITQAMSGKPVTVFGDGSQTRSFCFVDDLTEGILKLMESDLHDPVNLGNPSEIRLLDLAKLILQLTGSLSPLAFKPLPEDDPKVRCPDIRLAREKLKWQPRIMLEEGLTRTVDWFREIPLGR
ncbi:MAG: SDR family oxidoreductase [Candidatus Omnitrophica bacterium]|nr:SDR family oxidoreductase [Candidatus Omnitrophota bacterium]